MKYLVDICKYCILVAIILLAGCSKNTELKNSLNLAESIMHHNPDSAISVLKDINTEILKSASDENNALYALLLTQAEDKNYIDRTNDSLISIAIEYYKESKDDYHKMLAYYYKARINYNAKNYSQSILSLLKAEYAAKELEDHYHLGLIYHLSSYIYIK